MRPAWQTVRPDSTWCLLDSVARRCTRWLPAKWLSPDSWGHYNYRTGTALVKIANSHYLLLDTTGRILLKIAPEPRPLILPTGQLVINAVPPDSLERVPASVSLYDFQGQRTLASNFVGIGTRPGQWWIAGDRTPLAVAAPQPDGVSTACSPSVLISPQGRRYRAPCSYIWHWTNEHSAVTDAPPFSWGRVPSVAGREYVTVRDIRLCYTHRAQAVCGLALPTLPASPQNTTTRSG